MESLNGKKRGLALQNFSKKNLGGFTVVELLIVIGIIGVIGTVSLANLVGWRSAKELNATSQKIATLIREAESRAMSQNRGSGWGVHFEDGGNGQPFFSLFYSGPSGAYNPANEVERYPLPSAIRYVTTTTTGTEFLQDIVFDQITGKPRVSNPYRKSNIGGQPRSGGGRLQPIGGTVGPVYNYVSAANAASFGVISLKRNASSSVIISPNGTIAFDSLNCFFTCYVQQVVLQPLPVILSFTAEPTSTTPSRSVTLSWATANADSCDGSPWTDSREASGSATVTPPQTATYSLQCTGGGMQVSVDVTVLVVPGGGGGRGAPIQGD